jgi:glycine/D-amino acid oxidase-like deaminating enzyme
MIDNDQRVVIIGGGIAGLSSAWFLLKEGFSRVTLIERDVNTSMEASGLNSGLVRHYHPDQEVRSDLARSVELLLAYQNITGGSFFEQSPSIWRFHSGKYQELSSNKQNLLNMDTIEPDEVPPDLQPEDAFGDAWVTFHNDGLLDAFRFGDQLREDAETSGVHMRTSSMVESGEKQGDSWILTLDGGEHISADQVINAAGVWANDVGQRLGLEPRTYTPVRRHLFYTTEQLLPGRYSYFMDTKQRFFFRRTEEGTLISYCDEQPVEPDESPDVEFPEDHLEQVIGEQYPELDLGHIDQYWSGKYAMTPDRKPIIDTDPGDASVVWATGLNDFGMSYGLRTGERVMNQLHSEEYRYTI